MRNGAGDITDLVPLDPTDLSVYTKQHDGFSTKGYWTKTAVYDATEVVDLTFMVRPSQLDIRSPIMANKDIIGLAISLARYGRKAFQSGGIPPAVLQNPFQSGAAAQRASEDVANATAKLAREGRPVMALPVGHEMKSIGFSPEQVARIYSRQPVFLQDLSRSK